MKILVIFWLAIYILLTTGCSALSPPPIVEAHTIVVMPPLELFNCPAEPAPPEGEYTQRDVAEYIVRLHSAYESCWWSLGSVKKYLDKAARKVPPPSH